MEKVKVTTQPARIRIFYDYLQPDVILLDMNFRRDAISGQEGFDCLEQILKLDPQAIVLFMTAYADTDKAVRLSRRERLILSLSLGKRKSYWLLYLRPLSCGIHVRR